MKERRFPPLHVELPSWVEEVLPPEDHVYTSDEEKMRLALTLARENVRRDTGGPFGAAIFDATSNTLIAPGVNVVVPAHWSGGHAEMVAFAVAQQRLGIHDLGAPGMHACEIFSSTEPCAMCLGATAWTGVRRLVCSARGEDAEAIGFDEGPKAPNWVGALEERGIAVLRDLLRAEGQEVLREYVDAGGVLYNGRAGDR